MEADRPSSPHAHDRSRPHTARAHTGLPIFATDALPARDRSRERRRQTIDDIRAAETFRPHISDTSRLMAEARHSVADGSRSVHERLFAEALKKDKPSEWAAVSASVELPSGLRPSSSRAISVGELLHREAEERRQKQDERMRQEVEVLRNTREVSKVTPQSRALLKGKMMQDLRRALAECLPSSPHAEDLPNECFQECFQRLGFFLGPRAIAARDMQHRNVPPEERQQREVLRLARTKMEQAIAQETVALLDGPARGSLHFNQLLRFLELITLVLMREDSSAFALAHALMNPPEEPSASPAHPDDQSSPEDPETRTNSLLRIARAFAKMYPNRLAYGQSPAEGVGRAAGGGDSRPFTPRLNASSMVLSEQARNRFLEERRVQQGDDAIPLRSSADVLLARAQLVNARQEELRRRRAEEELKECTFRPSLVTRPRSTTPTATRPHSATAPPNPKQQQQPKPREDRPGEKRAKSRVRGKPTTRPMSPAAPTRPQVVTADFRGGYTGGSGAMGGGRTHREELLRNYESRDKMARHDRLYYEGLLAQQEVERVHREAVAMREEREVRQCTFAPRVNATSHAIAMRNKVMRPKSTPRSFSETIQRMREANQLRENERLSLIRVPRGENYERLRASGFAPFSFDDGTARNYRQKRRLLLHVDVQLGHGKQGRIGIHEGDDPKTLARNFSRAYHLDPDTRTRLHQLLCFHMGQLGPPPAAPTHPIQTADTRPSKRSGGGHTTQSAAQAEHEETEVRRSSADDVKAGQVQTDGRRPHSDADVRRDSGGGEGGDGEGERREWRR
ncbi:unnamed protein product [Vitrella brassicaformis CCMP3155]|uniref:Uncharacterized protein n=5 Tax=Vitrella brassicaformis TaxID=1169539 RepID=A0A0G4EKK2_VITBC|nr:unnamed protein product [Vitrella brassicaformis CCMP3155]|eukprot:CEL97087.1 unnamed protein product [Vitrella brassicaformis CCMP3155]